MRAGNCRHSNGVLNKICKAGITYRSLVGGPDLGWMARLPCIVDSPLRKDAVVCEKFEPITDEEAKASEAEIKQRSKLMIEAIKRIKETKKSNGTVECPKCHKQLGFSVAKLNGHIWGKCATPDCLAWMM